MPFLLPPPEFKPGELTQMGLTGTCEMQICRSAGPWSMGTPTKIEHSIQNAYLKGPYLVVYEKNATLKGGSCSNSDVRTFRLHRKPIFHNLVCGFEKLVPYLLLTSVVPGLWLMTLKLRTTLETQSFTVLSRRTEMVHHGSVVS